jgi:predicted metal-dependent hydrolase
MNWCNNSKIYTRYYDALSILFPAWEMAFASVAKHHLSSIKDPDLRARVERFIKEETAHASAHDAYNLRAGIKELAEEEILKATVVHRKPNSKMWLATMVSIEHLAVCKGRMYFAKFKKHTGREHALWSWHFREEIGHKALAIDLWRELGYSESGLHAVARKNQVYVLKHVMHYILRDFNPKSPKDWIDFTSLMLSMTVNVLVPMLKIYLPNFHPNKVDDSRYLEIPA